MDHPISASLSLIGFIHFNKMPALRFPVLNVADPLSVLSFSYLNLTWLNAQRYTERQKSLRWFITQQKQTQPKAGEDNRTKDTWQQPGLNGEISFTLQYDSTLLQVQCISIAAHSTAVFQNCSRSFAVDAPGGFGRIFGYMTDTTAGRLHPPPTFILTQPWIHTRQALCSPGSKQ